MRVTIKHDKDYDAVMSDDRKIHLQCCCFFYAAVAEMPIAIHGPDGCHAMHTTYADWAIKASPLLGLCEGARTQFSYYKFIMYAFLCPA